MIKNIKYIALSLYFLLSLPFANLADELNDSPNNSSKDEVELRIDFNSGSVIANEAPKVVKRIGKIALFLGSPDTIIADLNEVFNDAENGSALKFRGKSLDTSIIKLSFNRSDSTIKVSLVPEKLGSGDIIIGASDGSKHVYDTITILVKDRFFLRDTLSDFTIKSEDTAMIVSKDITKIFPLLDSLSKDKYHYKAFSSNNSLVSIAQTSTDSVLRLEIADSSYGEANVEVSVIDNDLLSVKDTFTVTVKKRYGEQEDLYTREKVMFNPGVTIFTGIYYSGGAFKFWFDDIVSFGFGGYYQWDREGLGVYGEITVKPPLQSVVQPYIMVSGGYHRQTVSKSFKEYNIALERDLPIFVFRGGAGIEAWLGKSKHHVIGIEGGYTYGKNDYSALRITNIGSPADDVTTDTFKMPPLHLQLRYSFFLKKL